MRPRLRIAALAVATLATTVGGIGVLAPAANACTAPTGGACGDQTVTFTLSAGTLDIAVPSSKDLGTPQVSTSLASTFSASLGATTVTDSRASLLGWTLSCTTTGFSTAGTSNNTVANTNVTYAPPASVAVGATVTGTGVYAGVTGPCNGAAPAVTLTAEAGNTIVSWNPTLTVAVPASNIAGTYSGTITQSVQ